VGGAVTLSQIKEGKMDVQLKELIELQREQNQLLKKYLWRFRFSLITLLLLTTATCCCLGFVIYTQKRGAVATAPPPVVAFPAGTTVTSTLISDPPRPVRFRTGDIVGPGRNINPAQGK
jgi:hypothetical protein